MPNSWRQAAQTWAWRARAEAWDEHERERDRLAYAQEREEWRERRRHLAQSLFLKVVKALDALDPATATLSQITSALAVAMDELRTEYDDQPAQRLQFSGDLQGAMSGETTVKFDLSGLPVEVLRALADEDEPAGAEG